MKLSRSTIETEVRNSMAEVADMFSITLDEPLAPETVLLDSGLDSLRFAMVIAALQRKLGYDPFVLSDTPYYPATLAQLCDYYTDNQPV